MTSTGIENTLVGSSLVEINRHPELNQPILALPLIAQWHKLKKHLTILRSLATNDGCPAPYLAFFNGPLIT